VANCAIIESGSEIEFQWWTINPQHVGDGLANLPEALLGGGVDADRRADAHVLGRQRACPRVDQFEGGDAVGVTELAADIDERVEVVEPRDRRNALGRWGMQPQIQARDHAERTFGADEQEARS
jgi:hypothetical protein